ncbi:hypothetical protein [Streptomyces flaveolus]|uniref:hypothetical protein n=1 Tax=Streptomyces flaveolus TaxID=67297 RepID=UPI003F4D5D76
MTRIIDDIAVSPDSFATGPDPSPDEGLGTWTPPFTAGAQRAPVQRISTSRSTATHPTNDDFR